MIIKRSCSISFYFRLIIRHNCSLSRVCIINSWAVAPQKNDIRSGDFIMPCDIKTIQAYVTLIKDFITGLSALTAAIIAILGLQAWKKQLKGKTEYELAQKYLRATYKIREALAWVRNPLQSATEIAQAMKEANFENVSVTDSSYPVKSAIAVYQKRFQKVTEAFLDLDSIMLEAETLWGESVREHFKLLQEHSSALFIAIQIYISDMEHNVPYNEEKYEKIIATMYAITDGSREDPFAREVKETIKKIESFVKPRLKI